MKPFISLAGLLFAVAVCLTTTVVQANVYPSGLKAVNNGSMEDLTYVLNENADGFGGNPGVKIEVLNASNAVVRTVTYAQQAKGVHTFQWDGKNGLGQRVPAGTYTFRVTTADDGYTGTGYVQISDDNNTAMQFEQARSLAVNTHPGSGPLYGRIYVDNKRTGTTASGRACGPGLYLLNADGSDALGQGDTPRTGGLSWAASDYVFQMRMVEVGQDDNVYIGDDLEGTNNVFRVDGDASDGSGIKMMQGDGDSDPVHTDFLSSVIVEGSLAANNLKMYAVNEDGMGAYASRLMVLLKWDINGGPLPFAGTPTFLDHHATGWLEKWNFKDLSRSPAGKFYLAQVSNPYTWGDPVDPAIDPAVFVIDSNGTTPLWNSLAATRTLTGNPSATDLLAKTFAICVSPDGSRIAGVRTDLGVWVAPLVSGLPDLAQLVTFAAFDAAAGESDGPDVAWDHAGNVYVCDYRDGGEKVRVFSPKTGQHTDVTTSQQFPHCSVPFADADGDGDVDQVDFGLFQACFTGPNPPAPPAPAGYDAAACHCFDRDANGKIDLVDFDAFNRCWSGASVPANENCANPG